MFYIYVYRQVMVAEHLLFQMSVEYTSLLVLQLDQSIHYVQGDQTDINSPSNSQRDSKQTCPCYTENQSISGTSLLTNRGCRAQAVSVEGSQPRQGHLSPRLQTERPPPLRE